MNRLVLITLILLLTTACVSNKNIQSSHKKSLKNYGDFTVSRLISVYDGDTFRVDIKNCHPLLCKNIAVRIRHIDTPEIRAKCPKEKQLAIKARDEVRRIFSESDIILLKNVQRGKYFRIVADVYADKINISERLLDKNLAHHYDGGTKKSWCH